MSWYFEFFSHLIQIEVNLKMIVFYREHQQDNKNLKINKDGIN